MSRLDWALGIILSGCVAVASAAPGDLDTTFGGTGVVTVNSGSDQGTSLALDSSNNVVVGGFSGHFVNGSFLLARFTDAGVGGLLGTPTDFTANPGEGNNAQAVLVDGSGRFVLVGSVNGRDSAADIGVARYLSDGTLDASFSGDGLLDFSIGADDRAFDAALDDAGGIVLVGSSAGGGRIARVTPAGALDAAFGTAGVLIGPGGPMQAVEIDGSARILVASNNGGNILVTRYSAAGVIDATFGTGGTATIDLGGFEQVFALTIDDSGRIVVAGSRGQGSATNFLVARLTSAGVLDAAFNGTGSNEVLLTSGTDIAFGVDLNSDGGIYAGGSAGGDTGVIKLSDDGTVDTTFGTAGIALLDLQAGALDAGFDLLVDAQGRILVAGRIFTSAGNGNDMSVARLEGGSEADLSITKSDGVTTVTAGTDAVYTIIASNAGPSPVIGATVADTFPATCVSVSWVCTAAGGATCAVGPVAGDINDVIDLPVGGTATYTATCATDPAATGSLINTASVTEPAGTTDPVPDNNSATDTDTLAVSADLAVGKQAIGVPSPLEIGSAFQYQLDVSNAGPSTATGVVLTDSLPANVTYVSDNCGASFTAPLLTWNIGAMAPSATAQCLVNVTVSDFGPINNTAVVSSAVTDPVAGNDTGNSMLAGVAFPADVALTLSSTAGSSALRVGEPFFYTVGATNNGPGDATGLMFTLQLSNLVSFDSSSCGAVLAGNELSWTVATLASGASTSCTIRVIVVSRGTIQASANVTTTTVDPVLSNNSASLSVLASDVVGIPSLDWRGMSLLLMLFAAIGTLAVRRRG